MCHTECLVKGLWRTRLIYTMASNPALMDQCPELLKDPNSLDSIHLYVSNYTCALPTLWALASSRSIREVWLESPEDDQKVGLLCKNVLCQCSALENLRLDLTECSDGGMKEIAKVMSRKGSKLRKLSLYLNNVAEEGAGHLAQALLRSSTVTDFEICATQLDHHDRYIGDKGVALICDAVTMTDGSCKLVSLTIVQNRITTASLPPIIKLLESNRSLCKLDLRSNQLDGQSSKLLASQLTVDECHLTHLILDGNSMISDFGTSSVACSLFTNISLKLLSLRSCGVGREGAESLATALSKNKYLEELILGGNVEIGNEGTECLARGMCSNSTLKLLDLSSCSVGDVGCASLATALQENKTLQCLLLRKNEISAGGIMALSRTIATSNSL